MMEAVVFESIFVFSVDWEKGDMAGENLKNRIRRKREDGY